MDGGGLSTVALFGLDETTTLYLGLSILSVSLGLFLYIFVFRGGSAKQNNFVFERLKPGFTRVFKVKEERLKNPGDIVLHLPDKRKFIIPSGKEGQSETLEVPNDITIKKGWRHFWWLEGDKIVRLGWSLLSAPTEVMDHQTATVVANRRTAGRLSTKNLAAGSWTTVLLAGAAMFAIGYILYPQFNHAAPIVEYCQHFANGTITGCTLTP